VITMHKAERLMLNISKVTVLLGVVMLASGAVMDGKNTLTTVSNWDMETTPKDFNDWNGNGPANESFESENESFSVWLNHSYDKIGDYKDELPIVSIKLLDEEGVDYFEATHHLLKEEVEDCVEGCSNDYEEFRGDNNRIFVKLGEIDLSNADGPYTILIEGDGMIHVVDIDEKNAETYGWDDLTWGSTLLACGLIILMLGLFILFGFRGGDDDETVE